MRYRPAAGMRKLLQLNPPASEKMLETRPMASRSLVFRARDGAAAGANVGLSVRIQHGEVQAVGARVAFARPEVAQRGLLARVDASGGGGRLDEFRRHGFAQRVVGGAHVAGKLNVRDIERGADLVVAPRLAVLRQFGFDLRPRGRRGGRGCAFSYS